MALAVVLLGLWHGLWFSLSLGLGSATVLGSGVTVGSGVALGFAAAVGSAAALGSGAAVRAGLGSDLALLQFWLWALSLVQLGALA